MTDTGRIVELTADAINHYPCCGITSALHAGRCAKVSWLRKQLARGAHASLLMDDGKQHGYIEYMPGKHCWRAIRADGYMVIQCIFVLSRAWQHRGLGSAMLNACFGEADKSGMHGVAVVTRSGPWMAGEELFLRNGFQIVDSAPPDYLLMCRKVNAKAPNPSFRGGWEEKLKRYQRGLTMIHSAQCPHAVKFVHDIAEAVRMEYGLPLHLVKLKSAREAQNAPTPYATFALIYRGQLLADHPISRTRFHNIMRTLGVPRLPSNALGRTEA